MLENIDLILSWLERFTYVDGSSTLFEKLESVFHTRGKVLEGLVGNDHAGIEGGGQPEMIFATLASEMS